MDYLGPGIPACTHLPGYTLPHRTVTMCSRTSPRCRREYSGQSYPGFLPRDEESLTGRVTQSPKDEESLTGQESQASMAESWSSGPGCPGYSGPGGGIPAVPRVEEVAQSRIPGRLQAGPCATGESGDSWSLLLFFRRPTVKRVIGSFLRHNPALV